MKRGFAWLLTLLALLGLLSGCGGGGDTTASDTASNSAATDGADDPGGSYGAWAEAEVAEDSGGTAEDGASDRLENAKMIYTARMEVETTAFDTADADLRTLVEVLGGYFEQAAVHDYGSGYRSGDYKVRIPADQFQPFLDRVGTLCHVTYQEQTSENVSEAYYDAESRLATQRTKLERLQNLLAQAENMEDIITIESAISETEWNIEDLSGTLRHYDALVDFATINVHVSEVYKYSDTEELPENFGDRLSSAMSRGWHSFVNGMEDFAVALAYSWMWLILWAVIIVAAVVILRKIRRRSGMKKPLFKKKNDVKPDDKSGDT